MIKLKKNDLECLNHDIVNQGLIRNKISDYLYNQFFLKKDKKNKYCFYYCFENALFDNR